MVTCECSVNVKKKLVSYSCNSRTFSHFTTQITLMFGRFMSRFMKAAVMLSHSCFVFALIFLCWSGSSWRTFAKTVFSF